MSSNQLRTIKKLSILKYKFKYFRGRFKLKKTYFSNKIQKNAVSI